MAEMVAVEMVGRPHIYLAYANSSTDVGHEVIVQAGYNTVWVRPLGDRDTVFELDKFDGVNFVIVVQ